MTAILGSSLSPHQSFSVSNIHVEECSQLANLPSVPRLTHIAWGPAGSGHDTTLLHLGETKVCDHDLRILLRGEVQEVFRL